VKIVTKRNDAGITQLSTEDKTRQRAKRGIERQRVAERERERKRDRSRERKTALGR
jgi:hypothetical protein